MIVQFLHPCHRKAPTRAGRQVRKGECREDHRPSSYRPVASDQRRRNRECVRCEDLLRAAGPRGPL